MSITTVNQEKRLKLQLQERRKEILQIAAKYGIGFILICVDRT